MIQHEEWGCPFGSFTTVLDNRTKEVKVILSILTAPNQSMVSRIIEALVRPAIQEMYGVDALFEVEAFTECIPNMTYQPKKPKEKISYNIDQIPPSECCWAVDETDGSRWQHFVVKRTKGSFHQEVGVLSNHYDPNGKGGPVLISYLNLKLGVLIGKDQLPVLARELQSYTSNRFVRGAFCGKMLAHKGSILTLRGTSHLKGVPMSIFSCESVEEIPKYSLLVM